MGAVVDAMPSFKNLEATLASECSTSSHRVFDDEYAGRLQVRVLRVMIGCSSLPSLSWPLDALS